MVLYEAKIKYSPVETSPFSTGNSLSVDIRAEDSRHKWNDMLEDINKDIGPGCGLDGRLSFFVTNGKEGLLDITIAAELEKVTWKECKDHIISYFGQNYDIENVELTGLKEISAERFNTLGDRADTNGYIRHWRGDSHDMGTNYLNNNQFKLKECIVPATKLSKKAAVAKASAIMADKSFMEELDRIYSADNIQKYYGNPVHYKISSANPEAAYEMARLLVQALYTKKRLLSRRINIINDIKEGCYREEDLDNLFKSAQGSALVIELTGNNENHGNYASAYQEVVDNFTELVQQFNLNTLCILIENVDRPGFSKSMISSLEEEIDIIDIKEGYGSRETALAYLENLVSDAGYDYEKSDLEKLLSEKNMYSVGEVYSIYQNWFREGLRTRFYKSYSKCNTYKTESVRVSSEPYKELQSMIGLSEIKRIVDEIIDTAKVQTARSKMGLDTHKMSRHMIFTGNPGSAKTTVARLLAEILRKEGILESGHFIECGRADLVGRYVGWTAPTIKSKFRRAKGGVLFIDEAYSLVSDDDFGDEAITAIVQEMENNRDDVIVIFAGYPDKMKAFLDKNEGLRSRIAFHLDFPDYNPDEMTDILKLMIDKKGYQVDDEVLKKCHKIFEGACSQAEFGNGRFARNLLEQAEMAQSRRIVRDSKGKKLTKKKLTTMIADDFDVNAAKNVKDTKRPIGFAG